MLRIILTFTLMLGVIGVTYADHISYIFNNDTKKMIIFVDGYLSDKDCAHARKLRPTALTIEAAVMYNGFITYENCK